MFKTYEIICETGKKYYGSTKQNLDLRLQQHLKMKMNEIQFFINPKIELLKTFETKKEMYENERFNIERNECCNLLVPLRTREERKQIKYFRDKELKQMKEYHKKNKTELNKKKKIKWEENKDKINKERSKKITCECGTIISKSYNWEHKKSKKHKELLLENKNKVQN